jgi:hypothetical protein
MSTAQTCAPSSKEMAQFQAQKNWQRVSVQDPDGVPPIAGFRDEQNHFHVEDLSRRGEFAAQLTVNPQNKSYDGFFKYCAQSSSRGIRLQAMRTRGENNRYTVSMRYLPKFAAFAGQPLADSGYRETTTDVSVKFSDSSVLMRQEWKPDDVKASLNESLRKQIASGAQKEPGVITLDLTGYDDVVCDLIQGNAKLTVESHGLSWAPLMQQKKIVDVQDLQTIQQALKSQLLPGLAKEKALFYAGRLTAKLEQDRKIAPYGDKKSYDILRAVMSPDLSKAAEMDWQTLSCVSDQMQSYEASTQQHTMELTFKFPSLEELEAAKQRMQ